MFDRTRGQEQLEQFNDHGLKSFNFVPLSTSAIPGHVIFDSTSLSKMVLKMVQPPTNLANQRVKNDLWSKCFNLKSREFKSRKHSNAVFTGMIHTDGVSVSICLGPKTRKGGGYLRKRKYEAAEASNEFHYFQDAEPNQLKARKVYIDPNKRDLLYCLGINKDGDQEEKLRYTNSQRRVECRFKKYSRIREQITRDGIQDKQLLECSFSKKSLRSRTI